MCGISVTRTERFFRLLASMALHYYHMWNIHHHSNESRETRSTFGFHLNSRSLSLESLESLRQI